jgi:hypothetical protein
MSVRQVYAESLDQAYDAKKRDLIEVGIGSRNKYTNHLLKGVAYDELQSRLKVRSFDSELIMVRDSYKAKDYDVRLSNDSLYCMAASQKKFTRSEKMSRFLFHRHKNCTCTRVLGSSGF